jgi:hypothetical protein
MLRDIARHLASGATVALTQQPRSRGATDADTRAGGERMAAALRAAGYSDIRVETLRLRPVDAACALGVRR